MKLIFPASALSLALILAACGTPATAPVDPVTPPVIAPPIVAPPVVVPPVVPAKPVAATALDASVDLTQGINASKSWKPSNEAFYLMGYADGVNRILAQTTLGTDGHAHLTLPTDAAIAPYLGTVAPTEASYNSGACTISNFSVSPASFKTVGGSFVLATNTSTTGYLNLFSGDVDGSTLRQLLYVDQDVKLSYKYQCVSSGREDDDIVNLSLLKGWNVVNLATAVSGTTSAPIYTHTSSADNSTSGSASFTLIGYTQASAPTP